MNIKRGLLVVLLAVMVVASVIVINPSQSAQAAGGKQVWVYYMGFWGGGMTWDWQADVLTDYPSIGKYDSRDAGVAAAQIDQAKAAGIDAFLVSWFGVGEQQTTTPVLNNMLDRASERGFQIGAVVDVYNPSFNRNRDELVQSLNYLVYDRANHPGYLRHNGKPVIFFAFQERAGYTADEWLSIRNQVDPGHTTIWIAEGLKGCCIYNGAMEGMYAFNLAWANGAASRFTAERTSMQNAGGSFYIPTIHPGWDETKIAQRDGRTNPTSPRARNNGQFLKTSFTNASSIGVDVILIVSWNEFMENSHIEPSTRYGTQSLDVLTPLIAKWKGIISPPPPTTPPGGGGGSINGVEAKTTVNVRSGPGTGYPVIGKIKPGTVYPVVGQQTGWYAISYNGQTGYVSSAYVTPTSSGGQPPAAPGQGVEAITTLNVRSGAGTGYSVIGKIKPGTVYPIVGQQPGWYAINYNGQTGYVSAAYVKVK